VIAALALAGYAGAAFAQTPAPADAAKPSASLEAFKAICLVARAKPADTAKAAEAAGWSVIPAVSIPAVGGASFDEAIGYRANAKAPLGQGVWVIIGRTPMPGFNYPADSCAVFEGPSNPGLSASVRAWAGGAPTVDDPAQQLIQYAFDEGAQRKLVIDGIEAAAPGLGAGTVSLVTVVPGVKRSVLVYSVVNP
jgi:hypothetical protein